MIVKVLGIIDILAAVLFWLFAFFNIIPSTIVLILAIILLAKGLIFIISDHFASILDILSAILIFISLSFPMPKIITIIITIYLLQKGILSLL